MNLSVFLAAVWGIMLTFAAQLQKHTTMIFYSRKEDNWNAATHAIGFVGAAVVLTKMMLRCHDAGNFVATIGIVLLAAGMLASYAASTVYHAWPTQTKVRERLRQKDHAAIYWHIAGSYAAVTLPTLSCSGWWGVGLLAFVWTSALIGTVVSFRGLREHSHIETVCFCLMGLSVLAVFPVFMRCISSAAIAWLLAEGVAYIGGAVVYAFSHNRPYVHTVFHVCVLAGSACHLAAVWCVLNDYL